MQLARRNFFTGAASMAALVTHSAARKPSPTPTPTPSSSSTQTFGTTRYDSRFVTRSGGTLALAANGPDVATPVGHAVICIHGIERNYRDYFAYVTESMVLAGAQALCIAPCFPASSMVATDLYWASGSWNSGSKDDSGYRYSGFAALDDLVASLNATRVTLIGHSGGGQFVHRYALATVSPKSMRFIVANPSSYTYLNASRPDLAGSGYLMPSVPEYDYYRYGLSSNLNTYLRQQSVDTMRTNYLRRDVTYLLGELDTDTQSATLDVTDQAQTQGAQRFERGTRYFTFLNDYYSGHLHRRVAVPLVGHSGKGMITSAQGQGTIFA
jgi:pimeloyl-ACP methyl ester carboxylesterase